MKYISALVILVLILFITSRDSDELWRDGNYVVAWINSDVFLAYGEPEEAFYGLVNSVSAVGFNKDYVVAKNVDSISKEVFFYIIDKAKQKSNQGINFSQKAAVTGPLSTVEFNSLIRELNLPSFTVEF
ncbi:hypothetical protein Q4Q49_22025 [Shewanella sp. SP1S1-7]|uniref:hypothetical protein n=1 Tax=Shewanella sp. SP1S1-7 TaxID=3063536 RepID=UPI00288FF528|nr:hypothetical protein [Shewanella sp. SP1S1-7]MDT3337938.1 hypothetical protein [Shewanella sp. SP1S1-7]